jgi:hypothetical protein
MKFQDMIKKRREFFDNSEVNEDLFCRGGRDGAKRM